MWAVPRWRVIAGVLVIAVGCEGSVCDRGVCFSDVGVQTRWGVAPTAMLWVDVDGDGRDDLVAANGAAGTVSVVWGADATLGGVATTWSVADEVAGLEVVDVDGDGRLDVVTAVPRDDEVAVLRGRGGREFLLTRRTAGDEPRGVIAAELENGVRGLVTVNAGDGTVSLLGEDVRTVVVGALPRDVAAGDLDGDGDVDLAVVLAGDAAVQLLMGDGNGGVEVGERIAVGGGPHAVVVADMDGDGIADVATADTLADTVSVLFADGTRRVWPVKAKPRGLVVVERAEGPGLAVLSAGTGSVQVISPVTGERVAGTAGVVISGIAAGDVDGAKGVEVIYAGASRFGALRLAGAGVNLFKMWGGGIGGSKFSGDVDGDGIDEVIVTRLLSIGEQAVAVVRAGVVVQEIELRVEVGVQFVGVVDVTQDGRNDVLVAGPYEVVVLEQRADGTFVEGSRFAVEQASAWSVWTTESGLPVVIVGGDGWMSVLAAAGVGLIPIFSDVLPGRPTWIGMVDERFGFATKDGLWVREGEGDWRRTELDIAGEIRGLTIDDVTGDGEDDAVICLRDEIFVRTGIVDELSTYVRLGGEGCDSVSVVDLNGDGVRDLVALRSGPGFTVVTPWMKQSAGWFEWASQSLAGSAGVFVRLDEDGISDIVMGGPDEVVTGWKVSLGPALRDVPLRRFGTAGAEMGDVNGDGVADVVLFGDSLAVGFGDGAAGFGPFVHSSREEVLPGIERVMDVVMVDVEGDGRMEVVAAGDRGGTGAAVMLGRFDDVGGVGIEKLSRLPERGVWLVAGDLDEDGLRDVVAVTEKRVVVMRAAGGFVQEEVATGVLTVTGVDILDIDGDGHVDMMLVLVGVGVRVFRGLGGGVFGPGQVWLEGSQRGDWAVGDVNRDGRMDAVRANGALTLWSGWQAPRRLFAEGAETTALVDLDGDGQLEVIAAGRAGSQVFGTGSLFVGRSAGDLMLSFRSREMVMVAPQSLVVRDFNNDDIVDIAVMGTNGVTIVRQVP